MGENDRPLLRPRRLRRGDTVGIVSTSWGGPHVFPEVFDAGLDSLRSLGLEVVEFPTARRAPEELAADPEARAADLHAAFADPDIAAIVSSIGGDDSARVLPMLDQQLIAENPKILMGYSDTSTQTFVLNHQLGLVTFNGPAVMAGFAQMRHFPALRGHVHDLLFQPSNTFDYAPFDGWVDTYGDWSTNEDPTMIGDVKPHDGWRWLNGSETRTGRLTGGCVEVLEFLKGSRHWPDESFWDDRILLLETSEEVPSVSQVRYWLFNYGIQGVLGRIRGLVFGRMRGYTDEMVSEFESMVREVVVDMFGAEDLPILTNTDFGHTDPQWILPLGVLAELDPNVGAFRLLEPAVD